MSLRLGMRNAGGAKYYLRGGYQQVDIDLEKLVDVPVPAGSLDGIDDSTGDVLVGAGAEFRSAARRCGSTSIRSGSTACAAPPA